MLITGTCRVAGYAVAGAGRIAAATFDRRARALWCPHRLRQLSAFVAGTGSAG